MKKNLKKIYKDILINIIFIITYFIIYFIVTKNGKYIFAAKMDFDIQHYVIPEYLREVFFSTNKILPNFAFNLGSGTNIYNLAYYGLLNPIVLISYLLPKIKMLNYIIISMRIVVLSSTSLMYFYLRKNKYSYKISFICAFLFLCSSPLIFHTHRHIMFIDYLPFLLLGFFGIDRYIEKRKSFLLIISVILIILTSYFFSISSLVVLTLLGIYKYLKNNKKSKIKDIFNFTKGLILRFIPAILTTSILIIPTALALLNGRGSNTGTNFIKDLLTPKNYLLYDTYSIGLTSISLISIIYLIFKGKKENKFLSIIILLCSIISIPALILNGFLYVNGKVFIAFIPLVIIIIAEFLNTVIPKIKHNNIIIMYLIISSFLICIYVNQKDELVESNAEFLKVEEEYNNKINKIIRNDDDIYRIKTDTLGKEYINKVTNIHEYKTSSYLSSNNQLYNNTYKKVFENPLPVRNSLMITSSDNILFEIFSGEKYKFTKNEYSNIYNKIDKFNDINIYRNDLVLPIGYATNKNININDYNKLKYPDNVVNLLGTKISKEKTNTKIKLSNTIPNNYKLVESNKITYKKTSDGYEVKSKDNGTLTLTTDEQLDNKLLFISFELSDRYNCMYQDLSITINNNKNTLTCKNWKYYNDNKIFNYILTENNNLQIKFTKGKYKIHNIKLYTLDYNQIIDINKEITPMIIEKKNSSSDIITGKIKLLKDSYFNLSIPYDKNFVIKINNKTIEYEKTNIGYIGFNLKKGNHKIEITYKPQGKTPGIYLSIIGLILIIITVIYENRRTYEK